MPDLTELLRAAATDPARRPEFFRALLDGDVYVLGRTDRPPVDRRAQAGTRVNVATWSDEDGPITPFFTSEATLARTVDARPGTDPAFVRLGAREFLTMLRGQRLVLDPDGDSGKLFTPAEVDALLDGREPGREERVVQEDTRVLVGEPAHVPPELPRVLAEFFATRPVVHRAHLGWITYPESGEAGYLVVVVADEREAAMDGFGLLQVADLSDGRNVDVIVVPPSQPRHLLTDVAPFYVR